MRQIITPIFKRLNKETDLNRKYPTLHSDDGKIHVLYVHCLLNGSGLYRMILPHLELNRTTTHSAIIGTMHKWDFNKGFNDYDNPIDPRLVKWADIVIFPALTIDVSYIQQALLQINSHLGFVMDVDYHIQDIPLEQTRKQPTDNQRPTTLINNLAKMDVVTVPNSQLLDQYQDLLREHFRYPKFEFAIVPNLVSVNGFEHLPIHGKRTGKVRIGLVGSPAIAEDANKISGTLREVANEHSDQFELVLFGWNGQWKGQPAFSDLPIEYHKPVNVMDYYARLNSLNLDLALLPASNDTLRSFGKSNTLFTELSALGIPVVAHQNSPYAPLIAHGENGLLADHRDEWVEVIAHLVKKPSAYQDIGQYAQKFAWKNLSWNRLKAKMLADTYS